MKTPNFFLIILILSLMACNKDCSKNNTCPPENYHFTLGGAKDYLWADKGSYWIYRNSLTNELDTHTCVAYFVDTFISKGNEDYSQHVTVTYEKLSSQIYSSKYKWNITQKTNSFSANAQDPSKFRIILTRYVQAGLTECFFYPFDMGIHAGTGSNTCGYIGMDSTYLLHGKQYKNVAKFYIDTDGTWGDTPPWTYAPITYFWAKDVGLICKTNKISNENWELIDYLTIH